MENGGSCDSLDKSGSYERPVVYAFTRISEGIHLSDMA